MTSKLERLLDVLCDTSDLTDDEAAEELREAGIDPVTAKAEFAAWLTKQMGPVDDPVPDIPQVVYEDAQIWFAEVLRRLEAGHRIWASDIPPKIGFLDETTETHHLVYPYTLMEARADLASAPGRSAIVARLTTPFVARLTAPEVNDDTEKATP